MLFRLGFVKNLILLAALILAESASAGSKQYYATSLNYNTNSAFTSCAAGYHICASGEWYLRKYNSSLGAAAITGGSLYWYSPGGTTCSGGLYYTEWSPSAITTNGGWTMNSTLTGCGFGSRPTLCCEN